MSSPSAEASHPSVVPSAVPSLAPSPTPSPTHSTSNRLVPAANLKPGLRARQIYPYRGRVVTLIRVRPSVTYPPHIVIDWLKPAPTDLERAWERCAVDPRTLWEVIGRDEIWGSFDDKYVPAVGIRPSAYLRDDERAYEEVVHLVGGGGGRKALCGAGPMYTMTGIPLDLQTIRDNYITEAGQTMCRTCEAIGGAR